MPPTYHPKRLSRPKMPKTHYKDVWRIYLIAVMVCITNICLNLYGIIANSEKTGIMHLFIGVRNISKWTTMQKISL